MAIFGNLSDLPLPEILTMVGHKSGCLLLWNLPNNQEYELHIAESCICGVLSGNKSMEDILQIRDLMLHLINSNSGNFEFHKRSAYDLKQNFNIPIEQILLSTAAISDEIDAYRDYFPNQETRFKLAGCLDIWLDSDLYSFWERSSKLLSEGSSAEEIARQLGLNLERVQLNLYKLRSVGKIEPMRAMESRSPYVSAKFPEHLVFDNEDTISASTATLNNLEKAASFSTPIKIAEVSQNHGLVKRMLKALSFGIWK